MSDELVDRVVRLIATVKRIPKERVTLDSTFEQLDLDSLDAINLLYEIEGEFNITVPDELATSVKDVRKLIESLQAILAGGSQPSLPAQSDRA